MSKNTLKSNEIRGLIPDYLHPVTESITALGGEKLMFTVRFDGVFYDSFSDAVIENYFNTFIAFLNSVGKEHQHNLAVWTHLIKRKERFSDHAVFADDFMSGFSKKYYDGFDRNDFYKTDYYATFVLKHKNLNDGIADLEDMQQLINSALRAFNPRILALETRGVSEFSESLEFIASLLANDNVEVPLLVNTTANDYLAKCADHYFGYDVCETRAANSSNSTYSVYYDLNHYASDSYSGMWDFLLSAKSEFVLNQSFIFASGSESIKQINSQINKMTGSESESEHQMLELEEAKNWLASGELMIGDYNVTLKVISDTPEAAIESGQKLIGSFSSEGNSTMFTRSNSRSVFTMLSMLPGSKERPLSSPKSTANLASTFSIHNHAHGKRSGNPIGDGTAIMPLKTVSDGIYHFNTHYSDLDKNVTGQKIAGHALILGASGTGKTTLEATVTGFLTRFDPMIFAIDYNRSTELFIRAYGGQYFAFEDGKPTGINPFQLNDNAETRSFLYRLIECLGRDENGRLTINDELNIKNGVDTVMNLDFKYRKISALMQILPASDLKLRIGKWCGDGKLAWCFDNESNMFNPSQYHRIGFDTTAILKAAHPACEPLLATLFHFKSQMQKNGGLMLSIVEEFWLPANFPLTQELINASLKAGRIKGEFMYLVSQSPEDAINCDIFAAIVQQTPTKIFLPNPDAEFDGYKKCGLTEKEFLKLKSLDKESRTFLIKQSQNAVFAKLDLYGFDEFLPILSGTTEDIAIVDALIQIMGDDPDIWIPKLIELKSKANRQRVNDLINAYGEDPVRWLPHF